MGSQRPMYRQRSFLKVRTAWYGFVAAFVFIAADGAIFIVVLRAILLECISTVMTAVQDTKQSFVMCDY